MRAFLIRMAELGTGLVYCIVGKAEACPVLRAVCRCKGGFPPLLEKGLNCLGPVECLWSATGPPTRLHSHMYCRMQRGRGCIKEEPVYNSWADVYFGWDQVCTNLFSTPKTLVELKELLRQLEYVHSKKWLVSWLSGNCPCGGRGI